MTKPIVPGAGPVADLRVIEMGQLLAGPFCGQLLADFGAEVIKVEAPGIGDPMREWGQKSDGVGLWWPVVGRNKKSVEIDLRQIEGQALVGRMVAESDVLLENAASTVGRTPAINGSRAGSALTRRLSNSSKDW